MSDSCSDIRPNSLSTNVWPDVSFDPRRRAAVGYAQIIHAPPERRPKRVNGAIVTQRCVSRGATAFPS